MDDKIVLIVEDNPDDELLMLRSLRKSNIANPIVVVRDGAEALDYLFGTGNYEGQDNTKTTQVILLDLSLPKLSGHEVLRQMRADPRTQKIPVVILTSSDEHNDIKESYDLGANAYVQKPIKFEDFAEAVKYLGLFWVVLNIPPEE